MNIYLFIINDKFKYDIVIMDQLNINKLYDDENEILIQYPIDTELDKIIPDLWGIIRYYMINELMIRQSVKAGYFECRCDAYEDAKIII